MSGVDDGGGFAFVGNCNGCIGAILVGSEGKFFGIAKGTGTILTEAVV